MASPIHRRRWRFLATAMLSLALIAASEPEKITRIVDYELSLAPDNRRIAFISNRGGSFDLYVMNLDGTGIRRLTDDAANDDNPAWSPDGQSIAFVSDKSGDNDLYIAAADGSAVRRLFAHPGADLHPAWSPDGRQLLFTTLRNSRSAEDPQLDLYSVAADGSNQRQLTSGPMASFGSWSPDGTRTISWRMVDGNAEIVLGDAHGRLLKRLTRNAAFDGWPSWSPDGRRVVFARERGDDADIYVVDMAGKEQLVAGGPGHKVGPRWSADGKAIYYSRQAEREVRIWRIAAPPRIP